MKKKDQKILHEIADAARVSRNVLARKVGVSREVFDYRIKKLKEEGIITGFQARINISNFVYGGYIMLLQSLDLSKEEEEAIVKEIKSNGHTQFIGKVGGIYDFIIGFTISNLNSLSEYINFINLTFSYHKTKLTFLTMINEYKDSFQNIFIDKEMISKTVSMPLVKEKIELDSIDKSILRYLGKDCTVPSWEIAQKNRISEVAIRKRIKNLVNKKIILGFRTMMNLNKLGYDPNYLLIKVNMKDNMMENKLITFFQTTNNITYATKLIGEYDYIVNVLSKNNFELNEFIKKLRTEFKGIILGVDNFPLFEMLYHSQLAEEFLK